MAKFHINDKGKVGKCTASVKPCQFGEQDHFTNKQDAMKAVEDRLVNEHGSVPIAETKKSKNKKASSEETLADAEMLLNNSKQEIAEYTEELEAMRFEEGEVDDDRKEFIQDELKLLEKNVKAAEKAIDSIKSEMFKKSDEPVRTRDELLNIRREILIEMKEHEEELNNVPISSLSGNAFATADLRQQQSDLRWVNSELEKLNVKMVSKADPDDLVLTTHGEPYALKLHAGEYAIVDPELVFPEETWKAWQSEAEITKGDNPGGALYSARINGHAISGITAYVESGEYANDHGEIASTRSGILAAVPTELLEELSVEYSHDPIIKVKEDTMITYNDSSNNIDFGNEACFFTGYEDDDDYGIEESDYEDD